MFSNGDIRSILAMLHVVCPGLLLISGSIWLPSKPAGLPQHWPRLYSSGPNEQPTGNNLKYGTFYFLSLKTFFLSGNKRTSNEEHVFHFLRFTILTLKRKHLVLAFRKQIL